MGMSVQKHVVVVDRPQGALFSIMGELDELGFRVIWTPTLDGAVEFVRSNPRLSLIIASAAAVQNGGAEFLVQMKELEPGVPIVWGVRGRAEIYSGNGPSPDTVLAEPYRIDDLREVASRLLCEQFYPRAIVDTLQMAVLEVLNPVGNFQVVGGAYLKANDTMISDLSVVLMFNGEISGHLVVGADAERARKLYSNAFPGQPTPTLDKVEDLVGELCNQILGRINAFFARYSLDIAQTNPLFIRSLGGTIRYRGQQPSLGFEVADGDTRIYVEYYVTGAGLSALERRVPTDIVGLGEIRYL